MANHYQAVGWNRQKTIYDATLLGGLITYLVLFIGVGLAGRPNATAETLLIRGLGTAAMLLLHIVLMIGPLTRLDARFLPLLYNRRHLGVVTFLVGLSHATFSLIQFHSLGDINPFLSLLTANPRIDSVAHFPFQLLGLGALIILFLMAATSHDFWLANLGPRTWKALHMSVYVAWGLLVMHVVLGVLQAETNPLLAAILASGVIAVLGVHLMAAAKERRTDALLDPTATTSRTEFVPVCRVDELMLGVGRVVALGNDRIALFRHDTGVSAVSNECRHQGGPLGEGRIIDGCITCPWHGYQYLPRDGCSPPPFTEKISTYQVQIAAGVVSIRPEPLPPGTDVEPALVLEEESDS